MFFRSRAEAITLSARLPERSMLMTDGFPYEEYACAIKSESNVRKAGVEASVIAVENDVC